MSIDVWMVAYGPALEWLDLTRPRWEALGYRVHVRGGKDWVRSKMALVRAGVGWVLDADVVPCRAWPGEVFDGPQIRHVEGWAPGRRWWRTGGAMYAPHPMPVHWTPKCRQGISYDEWALNKSWMRWGRLPEKYNWWSLKLVESVPKDVVFAHVIGTSSTKLRRMKRIMALTRGRV